MGAVLLTVILGTATPGGGFPVYGDAMAVTVAAAPRPALIHPGVQRYLREFGG